MHGSQIAEHAFALLLSLTRRIITQYDFMKGETVGEGTVHRVGGDDNGDFGAWGIGRAIATRAKAFEFNVITVDPGTDGKAGEYYRTWQTRLAVGVYSEIQRRGGFAVQSLLIAQFHA